MSEVREFVIRYDPNDKTQREAMDRIERVSKGEEPGSVPESIISLRDEDDFERVIEAAEGVAHAFLGQELYQDIDLIACPNCEYKGSVSDAVFPGGSAHTSDGHDQDQEVERE